MAAVRMLDWVICSKKARFSRMRDAEHAAQKKNRQQKFGRVHAYKCRNVGCNGYHVTSDG